MSLLTSMFAKPFGIVFIVAGILTYLSLAPTTATAHPKQNSYHNNGYAQPHNNKRKKFFNSTFRIQLGSFSNRQVLVRHKGYKNGYRTRHYRKYTYKNPYYVKRYRLHRNHRHYHYIYEPGFHDNRARYRHGKQYRFFYQGKNFIIIIR